VVFGVRGPRQQKRGRCAKSRNVSLGRPRLHKNVMRNDKNIMKKQQFKGNFEPDRSAQSRCAILQHTPEKPLRRSAASHLSIAL
jgi:hypothetical protein